MEDKHTRIVGKKMIQTPDAGTRLRLISNHGLIIIFGPPTLGAVDGIILHPAHEEECCFVFAGTEKYWGIAMLPQNLDKRYGVLTEIIKQAARIPNLKEAKEKALAARFEFGETGT